MFLTTVALCMATGTEFGKLKPMGLTGKVEAAPVIYFALESQSATRCRIDAWFSHKKMSMRGVPFILSEDHVDFCDMMSRQKIVEYIKMQNRWFTSQGFPEISAIFIDTLTKAMPGKDQNSVEDTSELFRLHGELKNSGVNASIIYAHHNTKYGDTPRGSSNIMAEPDTVLSISKKERVFSNDGGKQNIGAGIQVKVAMARHVDDDYSQKFGIKSVVRGTSNEGRVTSAPVLLPPWDNDIDSDNQLKEELNRKGVKSSTPF
jgi:hypothetical protein